MKRQGLTLIGLTGGIGMGKSTAAAFFRRARIPVHDADATVHRLQAPGGRALAHIEAAFPGTVQANVLDRAALRAAVLGQPDALKRLERIIHPLVRAAEHVEAAQARRAGARAIVLDIPLLLEIDGIERVDMVVVVSAPRSVQVQRVARRRRMDPTQVQAVIARQMADGDKRRRADVVVRTGLSRFHAVRALKRLLLAIQRGDRVANRHRRHARLLGYRRGLWKGVPR